ncbi:hypothetical protein CTAYLR_008434 [Chrysophaeum taylorii]|uniref:Peptidase M14 domain-containing protein n=1 Tax=Chrysophaeum taylorii TaxID=2483200 RepID=A0AAD7XLM7_9STRA|nr:hypothetical protein CTAYLR_008434 [Chrysophaeum taylorii]
MEVTTPSSSRPSSRPTLRQSTRPSTASRTPSVMIPPPLPLYPFPQSPEQPPLTGFAHTLPVVRHASSSCSSRLREPLQDPRRGVVLGQWFAAREREESETKRRLVYDTAGGSASRQEDDLEFDSWFESGNLRAAWRVEGRKQPREDEAPGSADQEYDLLCNKDTHTNGHVQWFYFSVLRPFREEVRVRLNIVNMMKGSSLYSFGMLPVGYCASAKHGFGWTRVGDDVCYFKNARTYEVNGTTRNYYTLSFVVFIPDQQQTYLAHCYPYTYSDLRSEVKALVERRSSVVRRRRLCSTLAGNDCDLLTVTNFASRDPEAARRRAGVVLTARVHPGESNASFVMRGCLEFLTSDDEVAERLRDNFVFKIVPMLNPDGVINGNYRSSLAGEDLNRKYASPSASLQPTVFAVKQLLRSTHEARGVLLYVDIHGHSRMKNFFFYGCADPRTAPPPSTAVLSAALDADPSRHGDALREALFTEDHRVLARLFPRIAANHIGGSLFSFRDSSFGVQRGKRETGRVVAWRELGIANAFTLEASFCSPGYNEEQGLLLDDAIKWGDPPPVESRANVLAPPATKKDHPPVEDDDDDDEVDELRARCVESWGREAHYAIHDLELAGRQLCLALASYANVTALGRPRPPRPCRPGELVAPRIVDAVAEPLLDYGVLRLDLAKREAGLLPRARAELELRALSRAKAAAAAAGKPPPDDRLDAFLPSDVDPAADSDASSDPPRPSNRGRRRRVPNNKPKPKKAESASDSDSSTADGRALEDHRARRRRRRQSRSKKDVKPPTRKKPPRRLLKPKSKRRFSSASDGLPPLSRWATPPEPLSRADADSDFAVIGEEGLTPPKAEHYFDDIDVVHRDCRSDLHRATTAPSPTTTKLHADETLATTYLRRVQAGYARVEPPSHLLNRRRAATIVEPTPLVASRRLPRLAAA